MKEHSTLKNRVRELRTRLEMRQSDLAKEIGVTRQTVLAIEKGRLNPSIHIALKAARVLREPVDYVFYLEHDPTKAVPPAESSANTKPPIWNIGGEKTRK